MQWKKMTDKEVEQIANDIFGQYILKRGNSHKQLLNIIKAENITFKEIQFTNDSFLGALTCGNNGQLYIMVNKSIDNTGRRNFTIAHELGHYFLKHHLKTNTFYCSEDMIAEEDEAADDIEREANRFASFFLMPEHKIKKAFLGMLKYSKKVKSKGFLIVNKSTFGVWRGICEDLTKRYGVSEAALRYRLKGLRLAQFDFS
jgi:Zn-dependent peptidase ImmA (M78 family)